MHARARSGDRGGRQGRDRQDVRARHRPQPLRPAPARPGADLRAWHAAARGTQRGVLQPDPGRGRVLRVPRAHAQRPLRDHGVRRHPRRPHGLLGRRPRPRRAPSTLPGDPAAFSALGGRALHTGGTHRRQRPSQRRLPADGAQAGWTPAQRPPGDGHGRRGDAQRSDHRSGLEQCPGIRACSGKRHRRAGPGGIRRGLHARHLRALLERLRHACERLDQRHAGAAACAPDALAGQRSGLACGGAAHLIGEIKAVQLRPGRHAPLLYADGRYTTLHPQGAPTP